MTDSLFDMENLNCLECGHALNDGRCLWCKPAAPVLPYAGTSGWSGSDTSKARAVTADRDGTTSARQLEAVSELHKSGFHGLTWKEISEITGWHHGQASGVLSVLHKEGRIARLAESRLRCKCYVLPEYVNGRETEPHGRVKRDV